MLQTTRLSRVGLSLAACVMALLPALAPAQKAGWHVHELVASMITLPTTDPGILSALPCSSCASLVFGTSSNTRYEIGDTQVSLQQLRSEFAAHPKAFVVVSVGDDFRTVRRVSMSAITPGDRRF